MVNEIVKCRACGNRELYPVVNLGKQFLASVFPKTKKSDVLTASLELVKCHGACGLLQLKHTIDRDMMYGDGYGYKSGVNHTMSNHLKTIVEYAMTIVKVKKGDVVVDIGSNDGTLLNCYPCVLWKIGVDPSAEKFRSNYDKNTTLFTDYFTKKVLDGIPKAKIITSIAMFYDLQTPLDFMTDIKNCLDFNGVWITEMAYLPYMLKNNSFDTICHEHLEYYGMRQIKWMADEVGLDVLNVELNDTNGGSFMVTLAHPGSNISKNYSAIKTLIAKEIDDGLDTMLPYMHFHRDIQSIASQLKTIIRRINDQGEIVFGYGASTKGNVILQYAGITKNDLVAIADRNPSKYNCFTPTGIPIISEKEARLMKPDYFLVLPWHFKKEILEREKEYISQGGKFIFPLPTITIEPKRTEESK
jgi:NDP-4-keto-2,6-dideoxyhexose 3-C-methyltransferase